MERDPEELEARLDALADELKQALSRIDALEARREEGRGEPVGGRPDRVSEPPAPEAPTPPRRASVLPAGAVALGGRTLIVLGGAYLLRAITGAAVIPAEAGVAAGLAYAAWWLVQADRSAGARRRLSAVFHGIAAAMIAFPLIWETTLRFELLPASAAAASLVLFLGLGLAVAWRRKLGEIAWTLTLVTLATTLGLLLGTHDLMPFSVALLVLAATVEVLAFRDRWLGLRWPAAVCVDGAVLLLTFAAMRPDGAPEGYAPVAPGAAIAVGLALPVIYLGSIGARTLLRERTITPFEVIQAAAALLVGFGGTSRVIAFTGAAPTAVATASLLLGAACYAAAFASIDRRLGRGGNFYSYTTFALVLILAGSHMILGGVALALIWSGLAVAAVGLGGRFNRITLRFHGAAYIAAAATVAGLILCAFDGLLADPAETWHPVTAVGIAVASSAAACYGILAMTPARTESRWFELLPETIVGMVLVWSAAGMAAGWLSGPLVAGLDGTVQGAFVAAGRTAVLATLAVALAAAGRLWSLRALTWLVYPVLIGGGLKLLWEDFRFDEPVALFLALAFYGGALVVTPRLMKIESSGPRRI